MQTTCPLDLPLGGHRNPQHESEEAMRREVGVRGTGGAVFAGMLLIIGGALWML